MNKRFVMLNDFHRVDDHLDLGVEMVNLDYIYRFRFDKIAKVWFLLLLDGKTYTTTTDLSWILHDEIYIDKDEQS